MSYIHSAQTRVGLKPIEHGSTSKTNQLNSSKVKLDIRKIRPEENHNDPSLVSI